MRPYLIICLIRWLVSRMILHHTSQTFGSRFSTYLLIAAISVFLAVLLAYYLTRHLTRPISQIIDDIDSIAKGDLDHPVHHTGSPEFTRLEGVLL